jgi:hypothetical protein
VTAAELVGLVAQLLYVAVFLRVLVDVVQRPRRANLDALLFFGILAAIVVVAQGLRAAGVTLSSAATDVLVIVVLALPYALLRLADDYRGVRSWIKLAALAGFVATIPAIIVAPAPYPPPVTLLLVAYFVVVLGYCASIFARAAAGTAGVTRERMRAVAVGAGAFTLSVALSGVRVVVPENARDLVQIVSSLVSLVSGIAFFVGFAPPAALLRFWREGLLRQFMQTVARLGDVADVDQVMRRLESAAGVVVGAGPVAVSRYDETTGKLTTTMPDGARFDIDVADSIAGVALRERRAVMSEHPQRDFPRMAEAYDRYGVRVVLAAPIIAGERMIGLISVRGTRPSLFATDDLAVLDILADQCAIVLENTRLITEVRALHAEERRSSENRIRAMVDASLDAVVGMDQHGNVIEWNQQAETSFGWPRSDAIGRQLVELIVPERHRDAHRNGLEQYRRTGQGAVLGKRLEFDALHRDGHEFPIELSITPAATRDGTIFSAFIRDITERRNAARHREELDSRLRQSERLESLGRLAGGVAHDLNNILAITSNYASFLADRLPPEDPGQNDVTQIQRAAERGATFTRQLLTFARRGAVQPTELRLGDLLGDLRSMLGRTLPETISFELGVSPELWSVMADRGQIEQLVLNLVVNAGDAMPDGGRLLVEAANVEYDEDTASQHPDLAPGRYVLLSVTDTGQGMPPEVIARAFEPFFTTKPKGKGTGLGLATAYGVVQQAGGRISIYSEVGRGTTVRVVLPATAPSVAVPTTAPKAPPAARPGTVVLVVEDEDAVREAAQRILSAAGYSVLTAPNGDAALQTSGAHAGRIDLLLSDMVMPGMSGRELARRLRAARPGIRVVYMSGYAEDIAARDEGLDGPLLMKPFTRVPLLQSVSTALDGMPA